MNDLPQPARGGDLLTWATAAWRAIRRNRLRAGPGISLSESSSGTVISVIKSPRTTPYRPPFGVTLITTPGTPPSYQVTVGWGYVAEIIPTADDCIAYHQPGNMWSEEDPTELRRFSMEVGQAAYVKVNVDEHGRIGQPPEVPPEEPEGEPTQEDSVSIVIAADTTTSSHYTPRVDDLDSSGGRGYVYYKLAALEAGVGDDPPELKKYLTGSHIQHIQDLPAILSAYSPGAGIGVIPKEWDDSANVYRLRVIAQKDPVAAVIPEGEDPGSPAQDVQIHVEQSGDKIIVKGNSKLREVVYQVGSGSEVEVVNFDDGLETLGAPEGNKIVIPIPTVVEREEDAQVTVTPIAVGYRVQGNDNDATFSLSLNGGSPETLFETIDGLVISPSKNINITVGGGTTWPPSGWSEINLSVCIDGTPTTKTFLVKD
jgi:hypothetical protein